jgi:hypothetical protein
MLSRRWTMAGNDSQWSAAGGRGRQKAAAWERGGRKQGTAIATTIKDLGYAADKVLGISAARYSIFNLNLEEPQVTQPTPD